MTAPHPPRMTNTRCSSFQLPGFIGSFHGYATFGGAFGSDAYARFCWALNPRESEDDKASLRKAETPDITCIRYMRLFARSNNDPKKKGSRFSRWSIFSNRERDRHFSRRRRRPRTMLTTRPTTTQTTQTTLSKGGRRRRRLRRSVARRRAMMRSSVDDSRFDEASSSSSFTSSEASKGVHVVSPGDSLYGVAVHYGVDPRDLIVRRRRRPFFSSSNTTNQSSLLSATLTSGRERVFSLHFEFKTMERDDFDETLLRGRN